MTRTLSCLLFLILAFGTSCEAQNQTEPPEAYIKAAYLDTVSAYGPTNTMVRNVRLARNGDILIAAFKGVQRFDGKAFTNITSRLPSHSFWDVLEDRKGNLWFGTRDSGVYRYDGKSFQHFATVNGIAGDYTTLNLYQDRAGTIWISTPHGATLYDGSSFRNLSSKDGYPNTSIRLLLEDKTGKLWFCAQGEDMFVYDGKTFTVLKNQDGKPFHNVWGVAEDRKGNIWFGAGVYTGKPSTDLSNQEGKPFYRVLGTAQDSNAHNKPREESYEPGLWRYDGKTFTKVSSRGAYAILEDKQGNLWTTGGINPPYGQKWALTRYDAKTLQDANPRFTEIFLQQKMLLGMVEDAQGNIWIGSGNGVYRYDGKTLTDFKSKDGQK